MLNIKKNFLYNSVYQIFSIIVPIITTPYLSRILGARGIGQYAYAYSIAYYFSIFVKAGLNNYGNRTIAISKKNENELAITFWNIYAMQVVCGIIVLVAYIIFLAFWSKKNIINLIMFGVIISYCLDITWFFYGMEEFKATTIRDIVNKIIIIICIFLFVKNESDVWKYALIRTLGFVSTQIILWPFLLKKIPIVKPNLKMILKHIKPNLILFLPTIAVSLYNTMDKIMLGEFSGELEVGYYESAEKVIQIPNALINALGTVMLPYMSSLYSGNNFDRISANQIIRKSEHFMMLISSLIGFGIMAIATEFVPIFLGIEYDKCVILLYVLLPSCIFISFANVIRTQYLIPNKYDKEFTISLFIGAVINFVSNSILIPQHQSVGAAVGTLVAETAVCIAQMYFVRNKISIVKIFFECIGYVIIAVIMFAIGLIMPINLNNLVIRMLVKILICGLLWIISMTAYIVVINKKFEGFGIWFNIVKKKIK